MRTGLPCRALRSPARTFQSTAQGERSKVKRREANEETVRGLLSRRTRKPGGPTRCVGRKIYLRIDERTLETRIVEVTSSDVGDVPLLPRLPGQIAPGQDIASVTAAYDTRVCYDAPRPNAVPMLVFCPERTPSHGRRTRQERPLGARPRA